jgi:2,4-diaminopentanoate dehydrogenase
MPNLPLDGICAAKRGLLSALDLPLITGTGLVKRASGPSPDSRLVGISR